MQPIRSGSGQRRAFKASLSVLALTMAAVAAASAVAAEALPQDTLKKIQEQRVVNIGYRDASIPFSYYDAQQKPVGYSIDIANLIIDRIKARLNLSGLQVRAIPITSQNRISLVQNGTIDFECTSTTNNEERARQVDFSNNFFEIGTRLLVRKNSSIHDFPDLKGQTVVVGAGTTSEKIIRTMNTKKAMDMRIISAKDHSEAFLMLSTGRARAMMMDDALLAGERAKARHPDDYEIVGEPQSFEAYGCMLRKNDKPLKAVMDAVIADAQRSGAAMALYEKWFMAPIPPKGLNLDFPMSARMRTLFAHPNDKPAF